MEGYVLRIGNYVGQINVQYGQVLVSLEMEIEKIPYVLTLES
jgi:hypothetical protein